MGKCGCFFSRATTRFSPQVAGVRGLVVRCLPFNPEGSGSNPCVCANFFYKYSEAESSLFRHYVTPPVFRLCETFFRKFFNVPKGSSLHFFIFCNRTNVKKSLRVPFRFSGTMRLLKFLIFCFRIVFKISRVPIRFFF